MLKSERRLVAKRQFFDGFLYKLLMWIISHCCYKGKKLVALKMFCAEVAFLMLIGSLHNRRAGRLTTAELGMHSLAQHSRPFA